MDWALRYDRLTNAIVDLCPAPDKFAHMCAGLGLWLLAAILLRRPLRSAAPLFVVIALEAANECVDRLAHGHWRWHDTLGDVAATWFWPVILTAALRWFPRLRR